MNPSISELWTAALRRHGRSLLGAAVVALVPAIALTVLATGLGASEIVNGRLVPTGGGWTSVRVHLTYDGAVLDTAIPVLLVLGWLAGVAVGVRLASGAPVRRAVRGVLRRAASLLIVTVLLVLLAVAALYIGVVAARRVSIGNGLTTGAVLTVGVLVAVAGLLVPARLALAIPILAVDGETVTAALRRSWAATRGRSIGHGASLIGFGVAVPLIAHAAAGGIGRWAARGVEAPGGFDAVRAGVEPVLQDLVLVAAVALHAALLHGAYRAMLVPEPSDGRAPQLGRLAMGGLLLLAVVPTAVGATIAATNPRHLPVVTVAELRDGSPSAPAAYTVLDDGASAIVASGQTSVCRDARCLDAFTVLPPCRDGGQPEPVGASVRSCENESIVAADLTPDGMLLALAWPSSGSDARLVWCQVGRNRDGLCRWGGAATVHAHGAIWENSSMSVAATPAGGFAAALLAAGADEQHGQVLLVTCDQLDCSQQTVHTALEIALPSDLRGAVDLAVDRASGALALGYVDPGDGSLWLGGCPARCPDGPVLSHMPMPLGGWPDGPTRRYSLEVVATPTGPAAVIGRSPADRLDVWTGASATCADHACVRAQLDGPMWTSAWPAVDHDGRPFVVGTTGGGLVLRDLRTGDTTRLPGEGGVVAAAFGPDDRLRIVLNGPQQRASLVTCAASHCRP